MSIYIIASIIVLLCGMVCYVFISQSIEKKRIYKQRILMALKTKHRNILHMLDGFPAHFLPTDLTSLAYRVLIDTCEQLHRIEPLDPKHLDNITAFSTQLTALATTKAAEPVVIDNPQQVKAIRQHLQELQHFVTQQEALSFINKTQANAYLDKIKRLSVQVSIEETLKQAKLAQEGGKLRLAVHYFGLAKKYFANENGSHTFDKEIAQLDATIHKIEAEIPAEELSPETIAAREAAEKEWEAFKKQEDSWQKKQVYD